MLVLISDKEINPNLCTILHVLRVIWKTDRNFFVNWACPIIPISETYLISRVALWSVGPPRPLNQHNPPLVLEEIKSFVVVTGHGLSLWAWPLQQDDGLIAGFSQVTTLRDMAGMMQPQRKYISWHFQGRYTLRSVRRFVCSRNLWAIGKLISVTSELWLLAKMLKSRNSASSFFRSFYSFDFFVETEELFKSVLP